MVEKESIKSMKRHMRNVSDLSQEITLGCVK